MTYDTVEVAANVVLFLPFGVLVALAVGSARAGVGAGLVWPTVLGLALSLAIEFCQAAFLPARFPTVSDLAANAAGALLGAVFATLVIRRKPVDRAPRLG